MRTQVARTLDRGFEKLAVSMLGAGVAADRTTQAKSICATMDRRPDTLHLLVVWPAATIDPSWFGWSNTVVVKTHHASALVAASDLYISAAGYNSFHEVMCNRVPAIFMPQMNAFMDDQRARARAAVERGLASLVEAHEIMTLDWLVGEYLDQGRAQEIRDRLSEAALPSSERSRRPHYRGNHPWLTPNWEDIASRITARNAIDIDAITGAFDPHRKPTGRDTATALRRGPMMTDEAFAIEVWVAETPERPADHAMRLAALAVEQDVEVIILSHITSTIPGLSASASAASGSPATRRRRATPARRNSAASGTSRR